MGNDCDVLICESLSSCTYCAPSDPVRDPPTNPDRQLSTTVVILLLHLIFDLSPSPPSTQARKNGSRNTQEAAHALSQYQIHLRKSATRTYRYFPDRARHGCETHSQVQQLLCRPSSAHDDDYERGAGWYSRHSSTIDHCNPTLSAAQARRNKQG